MMLIVKFCLLCCSAYFVNLALSSPVEGIIDPKGGTSEFRETMAKAAPPLAERIRGALYGIYIGMEGESM